MKTNLNLAKNTFNNLNNIELSTLIKNNNVLVQKGFNSNFHTLKTNETELIEVGETDFVDDTKAPENTSAEDIKPKVYGTPKEITTGITQEQQNTIDRIVEDFIYQYGAKEVVDNVIYKDADGNPQSQVIKCKNEDGTYSVTKIEYENGKISKVSVQKFKDNSSAIAQDGCWMTFDYKDDGRVIAQRHSGIQSDDGTTLENMVYYPPVTINPDGKSNSIYDFKRERPYDIF